MGIVYVICNCGVCYLCVWIFGIELIGVVDFYEMKGKSEWVVGE